MEYRVIKPFKNIDGSFLRVNDTVSCDKDRAMVLIKNKMIGAVVETSSVSYPVRKIIIMENATDKTPKKRRRRKS